MKSIFTLLTICSFTIFLSACATAPTPNPASNPFTPGEVSLKLQRGVTTKTEVLQAFGAPNIVSQNAAGDSVWTYQKNATVSQASRHGSYWTILLAGSNNNTSGFAESDRSMTLIISFNKAGIVKNFKSLSTNF